MKYRPSQPIPKTVQTAPKMMRPTGSLARTRPDQQTTAITNEMVAKSRFLVGEFFVGMLFDVLSHPVPVAQHAVPEM